MSISYQSSAVGLTPEQLISLDKSNGGYEYTGGFADRTDGQTGSTTVGTDVNYTSAMAAAGTWYRFGFDSTQQLANDVPYWSDPTPEPAAGVGLFGGSHMPAGVTSLFDFSQDSVDFNQATTLGSESVTAATGSFDFTECKPGDKLAVRFDLNITPQLGDTTIEVALIWQTRDASDNPTFSFALTGTPIYSGASAAGMTFLERPELTAYFASEEDVNARALLAVRGDQEFICQPLATLITIYR